MGQLNTLLWKNFMWCRVNYGKTLLFFFIPFLLAFFLNPMLALVDSYESPDCDFETVALPPSHPAFIVQSLFCKTSDKCVNETKRAEVSFDKYFEEVDKVYARNEANQDKEEDMESCACPGMTEVSLAEYVYRGYILYHPENEITQAIMQSAIKHLNRITALRTAGFAFMALNVSSGTECALRDLAPMAACYENLANRSLGFDDREQSLISAKNLTDSNETVWGVITFANTTDHRVDYMITTASRMRTRMQTMFLQSLIDVAIMEQLTNVTPGSTRMNVAHKLLPLRCRKDAGVFSLAFFIIQAAFTIGFIPVLYSFTGEMCYEKSAGLVEFLQIAGVKRYMIRLAWLFFGYAFVPTISILMGIWFYYPFPMVFSVTPSWLHLVICLLYGMSLVNMCMAISSGSPSAQRASVTVLLILLMGYLIPTWGGLVPNVGYTDGRLIFARISIALHPSITFLVAYSYFVEYELEHEDPMAAGLLTSPVVFDGIDGLGECIIWQVVQIVVFALLSVYFDNVMPSKYGFQEPWNYFLLPSYWNSSRVDAIGGPEKVPPVDNPNDSKDDGSKPAGIRIVKLNKTYAGGKVAVNDLNCKFHQHEITAFLGHNGAGKSTTMNMLTGMISPTSGTAFINGLNIRNSMPDIRRSLGYCPQYDIIYPNLSVKQHMDFFGAIKGISAEDIKEYLEETMKKMSMGNTNQTNRIARNLSGGMKRKLSIAVSFLGNPNTIILDEPTSAIDPFSRRAIWDLILTFKSQATILISTHYMQEADVLGDRIAIINNGVLKCIGSPLNLKTTYGRGSTLILAHDKDIDAHIISKELDTICPIKMIDKSQTETSFVIPSEYTRQKEIVQLLQTVEQNMQQWKVNSFGFQESTLEQVFFRVAAEGAGDEEDEKNRAASNPAKIGYKKASMVVLWWLHFQATIIKRFYLNMRMKKSLIFQLVIPLIFCLVLIFFNQMIGEAFDGSAVARRLDKNALTTKLVGFQGYDDDRFWNSVLNDGLSLKCSEVDCTTTLNWMATQTQVNYSEYPTCQCQQCPNDAAGPIPTKATLPSGETAVNLNGRNLSAYLLRNNELYFVGAIKQSQIEFPSVTDILNVLIRTIMSGGINGDLSGALAGFDRGGGGGSFSGLRFKRQVEESSGRNLSITPGNDSISQVDISDQFVPAVRPPAVPKANPLLDIVGGDRSLKEQNTELLYVLWTGLKSPGGRQPTSYYLTNARHIKAEFLNAFWNSMLRSRATQSTVMMAIGMSDEEIEFTDGISLTNIIGGFLLSLFTSFALVMPTFVVQYFVVNEETTGSKQLQILSGMNTICYWIGNVIYDSVLFIVSVMLMILIFTIYPDPFQINGTLYVYLCFLYGISMILLSYVLSFVVSNPRNSILIIGLATYVLSILSNALVFAFSNEPWFDRVNNITHYLPPCFITMTVMRAALHEALPDAIKNEFDVYDDRLGIVPMIERSIMTTIGLVVMLILLESGIFGFCMKNIQRIIFKSRKLKAAEPKDEDVIREAADVKQHSGSDENMNVLTVSNLQKYYNRGRKFAVRGVSFGVRRGECFGLLGVNGAGKSTLFQMLAGFHTPSDGDALLMGNSVFTGRRSRIARHMSYCPQQDVLFDAMSVKEHLHHYARIRGITSNDQAEVIDSLIKDIGLGAHVSKAAGALSGGNRRKLNFAISMLDYPDVIFLDEMTTGMDPKARRSAWNCLRKASAMGCATVITSHSMEECEQLCDRLVIMVDGMFECIGGVQHLKDKFGKRYNIKLRISSDVPLVAVIERVKEYWSQAQTTESHVGYLEVSTPASHLLLSSLFENLLKIVTEFHVSEYSVSQTSLEHLFVSLIKQNNWEGGN